MRDRLVGILLAESLSCTMTISSAPGSRISSARLSCQDYRGSHPSWLLARLSTASRQTRRPSTSLSSRENLAWCWFGATFEDGKHVMGICDTFEDPPEKTVAASQSDLMTRSLVLTSRRKKMARIPTPDDDDKRFSGVGRLGRRGGRGDGTAGQAAKKGKAEKVKRQDDVSGDDDDENEEPARHNHKDKSSNAARPETTMTRLTRPIWQR